MQNILLGACADVCHRGAVPGSQRDGPGGSHGERGDVTPTVVESGCGGVDRCPANPVSVVIELAVPGTVVSGVGVGASVCASLAARPIGRGGVGSERRGTGRVKGEQREKQDGWRPRCARRAKTGKTDNCGAAAPWVRKPLWRKKETEKTKIKEFKDRKSPKVRNPG